MAVTAAQVQAALPYLGLQQSDFQGVQARPNLKDAEQALADLKARAHKNFKKAARQLHPDVNGGDEAKTATFASLVQVLDEIDKLQVRPPPPPRPVMVMRPMVFTTFTSGTSTNSTAYGGVYVSFGPRGPFRPS